jgi:hypothetical protein
MKKKALKILIPVLIVAVLLGGVFFVTKADFYCVQAPDETLDFSSVIRNNVSGNARVVDIAMLGAHDAYADNISGRSSYNPLAPSVFNNDFLLFLTSGFVSRRSKTQVSCANGLLVRGVRYFDVRITVYQNEWYAHHNLITDRLSVYLKQTIGFLNDNAGEFIVFDIQHAHLGNRTYQELLNYIRDTRLNGVALTDFVNFDPHNTHLGSLTLGEATTCPTSGETKAGVAILAKTDTYEGCFHFEYWQSIRANWHNQSQTKNILPLIDQEYNLLTNDPALAGDKFRINQAQLTPSFWSSVFDWSLLNRAEKHNLELLNYENFSAWLTVLPIFMVDFSDSSRGDFNRLVVEKINAFNQSL